MIRPLCVHGAPRSSTTYHAKALMAAGFNVGHNWTDLDGTVSHWLAMPGPYPRTPWDMGTKARPNTMAAHVGEDVEALRFGMEIHIVRHPLSVIGSIRGGLLSKTHWQWFAERVPECDPTGPLLVRGMLMWLRYNQAIERLREDVKVGLMWDSVAPRIAARYRVEDQGQDVWDHCMRVLWARAPELMPLPAISKTTNRQGGYLAAKPTTWGDLETTDLVLTKEIRELAERYGYDD